MDDQDAVEQFKAISGCSNEEANHFLEACGGNVDAALDLFLQNSHPQQQQHPIADNSPNANGPLDDDASSSTNKKQQVEDGEEEVRPPIPQRQGVLVQESYVNSYALRRNQRRHITTSVFERPRDFRAEGEHQYRVIAGTSSEYSDAVNKRKTLANLFRPPEDIIHDGPWESARNRAQRESRWLLVNVQSEQEFACQVLNRDVWSNDAVKELVKNNFVFWQVYVGEAEGQRFQTYYSVTEYPFLAIMDPRTGELVLKLKATDALSLCESVMNFLESHPNFESLDAKLSTGAPSCSQVENGLNSARMSGDTGGRKRKHVSNGVNESEETQPKTSRSSGQYGSSEGGVSVSEPIFNQYLNPEGLAIELMFKFPDGTRGGRQVFSPETPVKAVIEYANSMGFGADEFDFVLNFPVRVLSKEDPEITLRDLDLNKQEVVHIERK